jgi:uncharacterized protein YdaU (DUF1376 family)
MPVNVGALIADTLDLTTMEFGAYFMLMMYSWNHPERLLRELSDGQLKRITGLSGRQWGKCGNKLLGMLNR